MFWRGFFMNFSSTALSCKDRRIPLCRTVPKDHPIKASNRAPPSPTKLHTRKPLGLQFLQKSVPPLHISTIPVAFHNTRNRSRQSNLNKCSLLFSLYIFFPFRSNARIGSQCVCKGDSSCCYICVDFKNKQNNTLL